MLAALVCLGALAGCSGDSEDATFTGTVLQNPYDVSGTSMSDTDGSPYSLVDQTDKPLTLVFFGYTHCPDICPRVLSNLASAMLKLDDGERDDLDVVFVTTDPARDDATAMRDYLDRIDPTFIGVTADLDTIIEVGNSLKLYISDGEELPSGGYDLGGHTTSTIAVNSRRRGLRLLVGRLLPSRVRRRHPHPAPGHLRSP